MPDGICRQRRQNTEASAFWRGRAVGSNVGRRTPLPRFLRGSHGATVASLAEPPRRAISVQQGLADVCGFKQDSRSHAASL